jgi:DNA-binding XRE family transcriptional regulator
VSKEIPSKMAHGGSRTRAGRPLGALSTEPSTLPLRIRAALGFTQEDFAREIGVREKTVRRYEKLAIMPKSGKARQALEKLAVQVGLNLEEICGQSD